MNKEIKQLTEQATQYAEKISDAHKEISTVIVGQEQLIKNLLIALVANGHVLVEGVPGLAKTLTIKTLSSCLNCDFVRIQFTPDILPADIIGTKIYDHKKSTFKTEKGPVFANFVLADEINRAPPKVQSALLEAMQERQVSIQGDTHKLPEPFFVMATQNPVESEGTYHLPEAQVDRFMFKLLVNYPSLSDEEEIITRFTEGKKHQVKQVITKKELIQIQEFNQKIYVDQTIKKYIAQIVDATRNPQKYGVKAKGHIEYGASPRASIWLTLGAKAHAMINKRGYVIPEDVQEIAHSTLRHRIILTFEAEAEEITPDDIINEIITKVKIP